MVKFKITPERFAEACNALQYMGVMSKQEGVMIGALPRFVLDENGEYVAKVEVDEDGDILEVSDADIMDAMTKISTKRLEKLMNELYEAANAIVNPTKQKD